MTETRAEWWHSFFPAFRPVFGILPASVSNAEANYIIKKLDLKSGKKFLDCPCGIGRISVPLAKKGIRVTGVDIIQSYLDEIADKAQKGKLKINLVKCDMRQIDFDSVFDAAGNLWTSFGFFEKESDNYLVLKKMYRALRPGGKFMVHLANRDWIIKNYAPNNWFDIGKTRVFEERRFDSRTSFNYCIWNFLRDGVEASYKISIRLYSYHELAALMDKAGFVNIEGFSSIKDEPISMASRMMFITGTRPL